MAAAGSSESICVGVRLRPLVRHERGEKHCLSIANNTVQVISGAGSPSHAFLTRLSEKGSREAEFAYDYAMDSTDPSSPSYVSQAKCYELMAQRMVGHATTGFSSCLICYGQTGTGKTMTIMGNMTPPSEQGVLMRLLNELLKDIDKKRSEGFEVDFRVQMLEVYNEKIKDLLVRCPCPPGWVCACTSKVDVHLHPKLGVYVKGATEESVETLARCVEVIEYGNSSKTVAATAMNAKSSRGHTVFKLKIEQRGGSDSTFMASEVFFVDLAGRENEKTTQVTGDRMVELTFINKSLMFLATCIQSLGSSAPDSKRKTERKDMSKFRNSKLTLLLSNALSGNSKTSLIGTLSPAAAHFEESLSTLRFASTVKNIKVEAKAKTGVDSKSLVSSLQDEIKSLKEQIAVQASGVPSPADPVAVDVEELQRQLESAQALCAEYQRKWEEQHALYEKEKDKRERLAKNLVVTKFSLAVSGARLTSLQEFLHEGGQAPLATQQKQSLDLRRTSEHCQDAIVQSDDTRNAEVSELRSQLESAEAFCEELGSHLASSNALCRELKAMLEGGLKEESPVPQSADSTLPQLSDLRAQLKSSNALCEELRARLRGGVTLPQDDDLKKLGFKKLHSEVQTLNVLCEELKTQRRQDKMELAAMRFRLAASSAKLARIRAPSVVQIEQMQSLARSVPDGSNKRLTALDALLAPQPSEAAADISAGPQPAAEKFPEPMRGYLWKKSPNVLRVARPWDRRYVTLVCGRLSWWSPEEYANEKSSHSREGGFVDLPCNKCTVEDVDDAPLQLSLRVQGNAGNFTGGRERTFFFDCEGSECSRDEWVSGIKEHMMCRPGGASNWVVDILRSGILKLVSARWLLWQTSVASKANHDQLPPEALIEPADAARLYRESGCLAVLN